MTTFGDIIARYEDGKLTHAEALAQLLKFGLSNDDAEEALGIADGESDLIDLSLP
jgi:hypothetical protein